MTLLTRPDNNQPGAFVARLRGFICLRLADTVTPAVRWYPEAQVIACNADTLAAARQSKALPDRILYLWQLEADIAAALSEPAPIVLYVAKADADAIDMRKSAGVVVKVVPPVSLWHESMVEKKAA